MRPRRARGGITLFRLAGIPVRFQYSWFVVTAAVVLLFGPQVGRIFPDLGAGAYGVALGYALMLMLSVLAHELAHALSARVFGWPPTEIELNLWGGHTQFSVGEATPAKSLAVALAGPAANLLIAGLGSALTTVLGPTGVLGLLAQFTILINLLVGVFNLLPGHPLDGGRIVESAVWAATGSQDRGSLAAGWAGRVVVLGIVAAVVTGIAISEQDVHLVVIVVATMVCFMLWQAASQAVRMARRRLRAQRDEEQQR